MIVYIKTKSTRLCNGSILYNGNKRKVSKPQEYVIITISVTLSTILSSYSDSVTISVILDTIFTSYCGNALISVM